MTRHAGIVVVDPRRGRSSNVDALPTAIFRLNVSDELSPIRWRVRILSGRIERNAPPARLAALLDLKLLS